MINTDLLTMFNTHKVHTFQKKKNCVVISEDLEIDVRPVDGVRWIIVGNPGSGKTFCLSIILNQFRNVWHFDPTGKFFDILKEQGLHKKWSFYKLSTEQGKDFFKINVCDLHSRALNSIFPRAENNERKRLQRISIEKFLKNKDRCYADWVDLCEELKLDNIFRDLEWILSHTDSAPSIGELASGKHCIDVEELSIRNPSIGVLLQSLIGFRRGLDKSDALNPSNMVVVSLDEAQDWCKQDTPVGEAFSTVSLQARKYGIGEILCGAAYDTFHPNIRGKSDLKFIFESKGIAKKYADAGLNINVDDFASLPKYHCFLFSNDGVFNGFTGGDMVLPSLYFFEKELEPIEEGFVVVGKIFDFSCFDVID
jgi:hypothetical protein